MVDFTFTATVIATVPSLLILNQPIFPEITPQPPPTPKKENLWGLVVKQNQCRVYKCRDWSPYFLSPFSAALIWLSWLQMLLYELQCVLLHFEQQAYL